jgi:hypothetical protein
MRIAAILLLVLATNAVFVKKASDVNTGVFSQLQEIDGNEMGRKLLDTIAL